MFQVLKQRVYYCLYGDFHKVIVKDFMNQSNVPSWIKIQFEEWNNDSFLRMILTEPPLSQILTDENDQAVNRSQGKNGFIITGEIDNPEQPLENCLDVLSLLSTIILDDNCISIVDITIPTIYTQEGWLKKVNQTLMEDNFLIESHINIIIIPQDDNLYWMKTAGMIKFGKPELSVHNVSEELIDLFRNLLNQLADEMIINNYLPQDDKEVKLAGQLLGLKAFHEGTFEDDDYMGNVHLELESMRRATS